MVKNAQWAKSVVFVYWVYLAAQKYFKLPIICLDSKDPQNRPPEKIFMDKHPNFKKAFTANSAILCNLCAGFSGIIIIKLGGIKCIGS